MSTILTWTRASSARHTGGVISEWEIWASAQSIIKRHDGKASEFIAKRMTGVASKGDVEGVPTSKAIVDRVDQLMDFKGSGRALH